MERGLFFLIDNMNNLKPYIFICTIFLSFRFQNALFEKVFCCLSASKIAQCCVCTFGSWCENLKAVDWIDEMQSDTKRNRSVVGSDPSPAKKQIDTSADVLPNIRTFSTEKNKTKQKKQTRFFVFNQITKSLYVVYVFSWEGERNEGGKGGGEGKKQTFHFIFFLVLFFFSFLFIKDILISFILHCQIAWTMQSFFDGDKHQKKKICVTINTTVQHVYTGNSKSTLVMRFKVRLAVTFNDKLPYGYSKLHEQKKKKMYISFSIKKNK
ncbi:hypothetical protein RFI_11039 [Reticulomyxa filosa]|uniref:Uncharacterized protein n=1 Tax=Reticulomyxa filosa TaxID=46433 RepID=X6NJB5_RETFI|nr:hypothetical protein RFI_11039 [Reticulomyxa filosa]|eukprot:ETO26096.1 hypothetical protein RFI_11039 [Reticulomyxa filosa]